MPLSQLSKVSQGGKMVKFISLVLVCCALITPGCLEEPSPFLDMASEFLQATLANQNGGGGGIAGIAQVLGSLMQGGDQSSKPNGGGSGGGAAQILAGLGSLLQNVNSENGNSRGGDSGFDPSMIVNVVSMFAGAMNNQAPRQKRGAPASDTPTMDAVLNIASSFLQNMNTGNQRGDREDDEESPQGNGNMGEAIMNMLPMVVQAFQTFTGPEMESTEKKHKEHANILPPFLEHLHVMFDHFQNSELAQAIFVKMGLNNVFKVGSCARNVFSPEFGVNFYQ